MATSSEDERTFTAFAASRMPALVRAAWLVTLDHHAAEDAVQHALIQVAQRWHRLRDQAPEAYARRVMFRHISTERQRRWREVLTSETVDSAGQDRSLFGDHADLAEALRKLPRRQRAVVVLRFYEDLSVEQTADLLGVAPGTVKSQSHDALSRLRTLLDDAKEPS